MRNGRLEKVRERFSCSLYLDQLHIYRYQLMSVLNGVITTDLVISTKAGELVRLLPLVIAEYAPELNIGDVNPIVKVCEMAETASTNSCDWRCAPPCSPSVTDHR